MEEPKSLLAEVAGGRVLGVALVQGRMVSGELLVSFSTKDSVGHLSKDTPVTFIDADESRYSTQVISSESIPVEGGVLTVIEAYVKPWPWAKT